MNYARKRKLFELNANTQAQAQVSAPTPGSNVDKLFYGAREHLQQAQKQFHELLELLQNGHHGIDSAPVADCYKATAESIDVMDGLAQKWQEKASEVKESKFDSRPYVTEKLFYEKPRSIEELQQIVTFDFSRFIDNDGE